jgi:hypothetical protein
LGNWQSYRDGGMTAQEAVNMNSQNTRTIGASDIIQGVPEPLRSFTAIDSLPLPYSFKPIVEAFWIAANKINSVVRIRKWVYILFGKAPFMLSLSNGEFTYTPKNESIINVHIEDMILLDCEKMMRYRPQIQVACILEELVHVFMNVSDETLVSQVVALLYDGVEFIDGQYHLVED